MPSVAIAAARIQCARIRVVKGALDDMVALDVTCAANSETHLAWLGRSGWEMRRSFLPVQTHRTGYIPENAERKIQV